MQMLDTMHRQRLFSWPTENISITFGGIILVLCFVFCWKQWKIVRAYSRFPTRRLDMGWIFAVILGKYPKDVPFSTFMFQVLRKIASEFQEEGLCVIWTFKPLIFIFNEKHAKNLVNDANLADKGFGYDLNKMLFGNGLLGSNHETWKVHRKLLQPAFNVGVLKGKMQVLNKYARQLADKLETLIDKPALDVLPLLNYCAFQNMADFVLGLEMNNEKHVSMVENYMKIVDLGEKLFIEKVSRPWLIWDFMLLLSAWGRKYLNAVDITNRQIREIMSELMKRNTKFEIKKSDESSQLISSIGDILMKLHLQDHLFTEKDVRDHLAVFTSAGYDTVSVTIMWCFYTLGQHPQVQENAYREIQSIAPDRDITYEDLPKLKYLECVIKETLRLYTTAPVYHRKAINDIQCGQYTIPKGSEVNIFSFQMHRDPNVFPEPQNFDPERFSDNSKLRSWMYIPFFEGYRNCIGKKFAMMEMKVQLVHVLRRFRITSLNRINDSEIEWTVLLHPTVPLRFSFENRLS